MNYKDYKITAEHNLHIWLDLDENGKPVAPTNDLVSDEGAVQFNAYNSKTGDEFFTTTLEKAKKYVDETTR